MQRRRTITRETTKLFQVLVLFEEDRGRRAADEVPRLVARCRGRRLSRGRVEVFAELFQTLNQLYVLTSRTGDQE